MRALRADWTGSRRNARRTALQATDAVRLRALRERAERPLWPIGHGAHDPAQPSGRGEDAALHVAGDRARALGERRPLDRIVDDPLHGAEHRGARARRRPRRLFPDHVALLVHHPLGREQRAGLEAGHERARQPERHERLVGYRARCREAEHADGHACLPQSSSLCLERADVRDLLSAGSGL